jgi:hypothetical protein
MHERLTGIRYEYHATGEPSILDHLSLRELVMRNISTASVLYRVQEIRAHL